MQWYEDGSNTLLFFVTEWVRGTGSTANDDGIDGSHLACRSGITSSFPFQMSNGVCYTRNYADNEWKVNAAIEARTSSTLYGLSAGQGHSSFTVFWMVDF
jgi:hypothetical protein